MSFLEKELKQSLNGEVHFEHLSKKIYSIDASIFEVEPVGIVLPKDRDDLIKAIEISNAHDVPIIARGAGTGITGGCIGPGLIIDISKHLNTILEINTQEKWALVEPGVIQDHLNTALNPHQLRLGPDTSTGNRATIGGMAANNAAGSYSLRYGMMVDHVIGLELILSDGIPIWFDECDEQAWKEKCTLSSREGEIYRVVDDALNTHKSEIKKRFPKIPRHASGYNLDALLSFPRNLSKLIVGSEGSLGVISTLKIKLSPLPNKTTMTLLPFDSLQGALAAVPPILKKNPLSLELIDEKIISFGMQSPLIQTPLELQKNPPKALLIIQFDNGQTIDSGLLFTDKKEMDAIWSLRQHGLELLLTKRSYQRAVGFLEDMAVAPEKLQIFVPKFLDFLSKRGKEAGVFGHVGAGCIHIRPYLDINTETDRKLMIEAMHYASEQLLEESGAVSGEHGDGYIRSWLNQKMFGETLYHIFTQIKQAFDPKQLMNPGKVLSTQLPSQNFRKKPPEDIPSPFLNFEKEGGIALAADLCNGNALCRKQSGLMCPSFQATQDEFDTTRARAQALRSTIQGNLPTEDLVQVLDLCLECKGCKRECPVQIDMAKMKAEALYQHQEKKGYSFRSRLFANIGLLQSYTPSIFFSLIKPFLKVIGVHKKRALPHITSKRFSSLVKKTTQPESSKKIVLFSDTFTEFNTPAIGKKTLQILNHLDYEVIVPKWQCCGRTYFSKGFLKQAKSHAEALVELLYPFAAAKLPIIVLEPSCLSMLKDDYKGLLLEDAKLDCIAAAVTSIEDLLSNELQEVPHPLDSPILVHGHCHQKALYGIDSTLKLLQKLTTGTVSEIPSGCCGLAGSFGYEKEHYDLSMKIGDLVLFPAIQNMCEDSIIVTSGTSCRSQILHGTDTKAHHPIEIVHRAFFTQ